MPASILPAPRAGLVYLPSIDLSTTREHNRLIRGHRTSSLLKSSAGRYSTKKSRSRTPQKSAFFQVMVRCVAHHVLQLVLVTALAEWRCVSATRPRFLHALVGNRTSVPKPSRTKRRRACESNSALLRILGADPLTCTSLGGRSA